ncbi:MAG: ribokinase [Firmicutes bacterium]|nr:ribokinase [Bacillota bacterium]MCL1953497.1 ribokinase [Bacillota bacterium]
MTDDQSSIFVVGSINIDFCNSVSHFPKIGETLLSHDFWIGLGGKGANQAIACAKLGGIVHMIGAVGDDEYSKFATSQLTNKNVNCDTIFIKNDMIVGMAMIAISGSDNNIIVAPNANFGLCIDDIKNGLEKAKQGDLLIIQLEIRLELVKYALQLAKSKGMNTILNAAPANCDVLDILNFVDILVLNETECQILTGIEPINEINTVLAVKYLLKFGVQSVVITLGENGSVVSQGKQLDYIDCLPTTVVDTTSAGDGYIGAMSTKLAKGYDLVSSAKFGGYVASVVVSRKGASDSIPSLIEIL